MQSLTRSMFTASFAVILLTPAWAGSGTISATPNPCPIEPGKGHCTSFLTWNTQGVQAAKVFVKDETNGVEKEFGATRSCGALKCPANWIEPHRSYVFTLYDYSQGSRGASLASIVITSTGGASAQAAAPSGPGSGNITASPNPCVIPPGANVCSVYLSWSSTGVTRVYVENLGKGHEREYSANSRCEHCEANWIQADSKYLFTLYDFSSGAKSKALGSVTVTATR